MKKYLIIAAIFCVSVFIIIGSIIYSDLEDLEETFDPIVSFKKLNTKPVLYLQGRQWGLSGNHSQICLSTDSTFTNQKSILVKFKTSEVFYKVEQEKLRLFVNENQINDDFKMIDASLVEVVVYSNDVLDINDLDRFSVGIDAEKISKTK